MAKVKIVQLATPNIDEYARYSIASIKKYAQRHGYEYIVQRKQSVLDLHINWSKIDMLSKALDNSTKGDSSYVVMIDADTVIINRDRPIEYFIERYQKSETAIFMAKDTPFHINLKKVPNAGFVVVKNNDTGRSIIKKWMHAAYNEGKQYNDIHPRNQLVYWNCVEPFFKNNQIVLPGYYFHKPLWWLPKPLKSWSFLYHVSSTKSRKRHELMREFYDKIWNDDENLSEVNALLENNNNELIKVN